MKDIGEDKKLLKLKEEYYEVLKRFNQAEKDLREEYFSDVNEKVRKFEREKEEQFHSLINKTQLKNSLLEFRIDYDPRHISMRGEVRSMKIDGKKYNLLGLCLKFPPEKRNHETLNIVDQTYKSAVMSIEHELIEFGLHPSSRPCVYVNVEKFLEKNRISGFIPFLY